MSDEYPLTLYQLDQTRGDLFRGPRRTRIPKTQIARLPTRKDLARMALAIIISAAGLVLLGIELLSR
jgi:hypothetical protein